MVVGDRVIIGDIKERQQARVDLRAGPRAGQKAALTEQERPNIFTNSVANIGPGETVLVQIEYQEPVHQSGDEFSLRLPLVVGPRYNPAPIVQSVDFRNGRLGWGATNPIRCRTATASRRRCWIPRRHAPVNPTRSRVRLKAGFPLGEVKSHHHNVKIESPDNATRIITLADGAGAGRPRFRADLEAGRREGTVGRPVPRACRRCRLSARLRHAARRSSRREQKPLPREVIFVIDNSGSMGGTSIVQAKASLHLCARPPAADDRFNVIRFDDTMDVLFPDSVPADPDTSRRRPRPSSTRCRRAAAPRWCRRCAPR